MNKIDQDFSPKTKAFPHQIEAINYLLENKNAALFDEQGLGKTKIIIDALSAMMKNGEIDGALVVAPLSLVYTWEQEVTKHSYLIPIVLKGSKREKRYNFLTGANFYMTNYEAIIFEFERIRRFCKSRRIAIILDEAARIKNPATRTAQAIFGLAPLARRRIIATGTPIANKPIDLWALFYFLDQGELLGNKFDEFKKMYDEKDPEYIKNITILRETILNNSMRRIKNEVLELPEKIYKNILIKLTGKQKEMYDQLRNELRLEIIDMSGQKIVDEANNILKRMLRLTQVASDPGLVDDGFKEIPAKYPALLKIISKGFEQGEKIIVWTSFVGNILKLRRHLIRYNPLIIYGEIDIRERKTVVEKFQNDNNHWIIIANPSAAREGLTLTRANTAIYFDRNFSLIDYLQSQDRIHRISQNKPCSIYKLVAEETIDVYVDKIINWKTDVAQFIEGDSQSIDNESILFNKEELIKMLGGH